jgi:serine/threonine protein kinase
MLPSGPTLLWGARAGGFELLRRLGGGGQAEVYLARPEGGRRAELAALKVARPGQAAALHDEHGWLTRPAAEHPGLTRLYSRRHGGPGDIGYVEPPGAGRAPFLALAYVPGITLESLLISRRGRGLPLALALSIAAQAASALGHLHLRMGLVHHDVKPANLLVGPGPCPHITLIDLGAAESPAAPRRRIYGTPGYLPPECAVGAPASPQVDIYGLGLVLRALLAGQRPPAGIVGLIRDATDPDPLRRARALPDMAAMLLRLRQAQL